MLAPVLNTAIINQFLDQFSRALAPDVHAALIWGGAGFHRAHNLVVPANDTLISLPPYSPELNGIENLWHDRRSHCWSIRAYAHYDELFGVASESWCRYCLDTELIKSVSAKTTSQHALQFGDPYEHSVPRPPPAATACDVQTRSCSLECQISVHSANSHWANFMASGTGGCHVPHQVLILMFRVHGPKLVQTDVSCGRLVSSRVTFVRNSRPEESPGEF